MDSSDTDFIVKAKRQLRAARWVTAGALAVTAGSFLVSMFPGRYHDLSRAISSAALLSAFLINSDFTLFSGPITRSDLIGALEAKVTREPVALTHMLKTDH